MVSLNDGECIIFSRTTVQYLKPGKLRILYPLLYSTVDSTFDWSFSGCPIVSRWDWDWDGMAVE